MAEHTSRITKTMIGILFILLTVILTGCLDPVSIEDNGYVISIGADLGKEKKYFFTLMLQRESSGQSSDKEGGAIMLSAEGDDIYDAVNAIESNYPSALNFARTEFFIFGRDAAESGALEEILDFPLDSLRIRASAVVLIADETAMSLIGGLASNNEDNITRLQSAILQDKEHTGIAVVSSLGRMYEACYEKRFDICAALGGLDPEVITDMSQKETENEGGDPLESAAPGDRIGGLMAYIKGTAIFDGWRMTTELDVRETMMLNMAIGEFREGTYTYKDMDGNTVTLMLKSKKRDMSLLDISDGTLGFKLDIKLYGVLLREKSRAKADEEAELKYASELIKKEIVELFEKCRKANSDAMRLGTEASRHFSSVEEWNEFDWKSRYKDSFLEVEVCIDKVDGGSREVSG